jgi:hypothetical protein
MLVEMVIPDDNRPSRAPLMDLNMLVLLPGRERTAGQYSDLPARAPSSPTNRGDNHTIQLHRGVSGLTHDRFVGASSRLSA